jgi:ubiquinone/menaquinone biosynthesis C-methylase UbiE
MSAELLCVRILHRIVAKPVVYNLLQRLAGVEKSRGRARRALANTSGVLLDIGAGTGLYADVLPPGVRYIWLDNDAEKLRGFRRAHPQKLALLGDASRMPIRDGGVDYAMSISMSHHLTDAEFDSFLRAVARVCRRGFLFLDGTDQPQSFVSRLLWKYDRGSQPRKPEVLREFLERYFVVQSEELYRIYHTYLLCLAVPKPTAEPAKPSLRHAVGP